MSLKVDKELLDYLENFDSKEVGRRLKEVRLHLSNRNSQKITQNMISELLNLSDSNSTLSNLEAGKGTINNFIKLLSLYQRYGYNLNWIILPDNTFENIHNEENQMQSLQQISVSELFYEKKIAIQNAIKALRTAEKELTEAFKQS